MEYQTIEGTWEEILEYSGELSGQRVKLTVLPPQTSDYSNQKALAQKLKQQKPFSLSPAPQGSAYTDTSINHDAVLAEFTLSNQLSSEES